MAAIVSSGSTQYATMSPVQIQLLGAIPTALLRVRALREGHAGLSKVPQTPIAEVPGDLRAFRNVQPDYRAIAPRRHHLVATTPGQSSLGSCISVSGRHEPVEK